MGEVAGPVPDSSLAKEIWLIPEADLKENQGKMLSFSRNTVF
jgi:hypothetical protein